MIVLPAPRSGRFPVDVIEIARTLKVQVYLTILPDKISGILHKFPGKSYLYVNITHSWERQRFTIAHELGHHLFDPAGTYLTYNAQEAWTMCERRASRFAAQLLMPRSEVRRCVRARMCLTDMCQHFGVSAEAMTLRLDELGYRLVTGGYKNVVG
ncbi:MAG: ImmA/IrrE family metallo-endopeptidase [Syntrophothermus sp.]|uniref:ImmA/IrrE family metallo-endopeptidase n=1 Tax=Syntrophothermus sp. TaxID=2736299 RepID=UPI002580240C|nr:ImmA/IrrE family metallo-endopeptidase [Syntrophothermus sp.]NSW84489.1 ImmA/IrrE family metallo-endopeptidase [Syntrophothermus sp.]